MVVGNGLLARAFDNYINNQNVVIYASGVSNSSEDSLVQFQKELNVLKKCINDNEDKTIIYFSTCSINDKTLTSTEYVKHKMYIENLISTTAKKYTIFRLPIVIGKSKNKFTLYNFLKEKISNNEEVFIKKEAFRYLVDIDDVSLVLSKIIDNEFAINKIVDIVFSEKISVLEMASIIKEEIQSKSKITLIDGGDSYSVDAVLLNLFLEENSIYFPVGYNEKILKKYLKNDK